MERFWLVWKQNGGLPTVQHDSDRSARQEAERLARVHAGSTFYVLELVGSCKKTDIAWDWIGTVDDSIPF